ncbi:hypothetical protein [Geminisphaera colitermitum]|uniref:hypothetical protein n=1 Tax=Geminisphaera colitermitum TaxID=1148786 RepID=UPI0001964DD6|nr:hypothetical protein [Geminisphaera colitermitum]
MKRILIFTTLLFPLSALFGAMSVPDARLTGNGQVPSGSTLTVAAGGTLTAAPGSIVNGLARAPTVAIFILPLGTGWQDFEIKATLSNFGEHTPFTDLYLYYHSPDPARVSVSGQTGPKPTVFFTDSGWTDRRRWRRQSTTESIYAMRSSTSATVAAAIVVVPVDATIQPDNPNLIWSYQRISGGAYENIWHPIVPTWALVAPNP